uniref:GPALPP motifs-containing protein 1 n=1 Tax=Echinostoma caproni TaxID=27848 RepID=A0A183A4I3_9TREM
LISAIRTSSVSPARPPSAMIQRGWPETDVDAVDEKIVRKSDSLDVKKTNSMESIHSRQELQRSRDDLHRSMERPRSQEHGSRTK